MSSMTLRNGGISGLRNQVAGVLTTLGRVPFSALQLLLRLGVAAVFFRSGMTKIANWDFTVALFTNEYQVPLLPPEVAAALATTAELTCPVLLVLGIGARFGALALLGMTFVIQTFVYPDSWPEHLLWASILLTIFSRGAGVFSIDYLVSRVFLGSEGR